jgi:hypothetical protein
MKTFNIILQAETVDKFSIMFQACLSMGASAIEIKSPDGKVLKKITLAEVAVDVNKEIIGQVEKQVTNRTGAVKRIGRNKEESV